jgi:hypothetical protein
MDNIDTCLVALLMLATMIVSVFCDFRFLAESTPMSRMLTTSSGTATMGTGVGVAAGVGLTAGVVEAVGLGGTGVAVHAGVSVGLTITFLAAVGAAVPLAVKVTEGTAA